MRIPLLVFVFAFAFGCAVGTVSVRQLAVKNTSFEEPISYDSVKGWSVAGGGKVEKIEIDGKSWQTLPMDGSSRGFWRKPARRF